MSCVKVRVLCIIIVLFCNINYCYSNITTDFDNHINTAVLGCGVNVQQYSDGINVTELKCNVRTLHDQVPSINSVKVSSI